MNFNIILFDKSGGEIVGVQPHAVACVEGSEVTGSEELTALNFESGARVTVVGNIVDVVARLNGRERHERGAS